MNILLAIDPSPASDAALGALLARPHSPATKIAVLTVIDPKYLEGDQPSAEELEMHANSLVHRAAGLLRSRGVEATPLVMRGDPKDAIVDYATSLGADFVFLGAHGETHRPQFLLGSVARTVLRLAPCSVGVMRSVSSFSTSGGGMKILLAIDGSQASLVAAHSIASRPWAAKTEVRIVNVVETPPAETIPYAVGVGELMSDEASQASLAVARSAETVLAGHNLKVAIQDPQLFGSPKQAILDAGRQWPADLIVVGAHGHSGVGRFLFGGVSEAVAMHAGCSVEVIRDKAKR